MSKFAQQSPGAMSRSQKALSPLLRVALLLGVVIHLAAFWGFRVASVPLPAPESSGSFICYAPETNFVSGGELGEQAMLFDSCLLYTSPSPRDS